MALLLVSLSSAVGYWDLSDMAVLTTTFLQSFAVMYCVHWGWHRHDLSLDAVIKVKFLKLNESKEPFVIHF